MHLSSFKVKARSISFFPDWLKSAQSFMTLAMFGFFITLPAYLAYIFVGRSDENKRVLIIALGSSGVTGKLCRIKFGGILSFVLFQLTGDIKTVVKITTQPHYI